MQYADASFAPTLLPPEILERGIEGDETALRSPEVLSALRSRLSDDDWDNLLLSCGEDGIFVTVLGPGCGQYEGKSLRELTGLLGEDIPETIARLLGLSKGQGTIVYHALAEQDLQNFLLDDACSLGTDAFARNYEGPTAAGKPHPRNYGAFPRFLRRYVLEQRLFTMEEGVAKITSAAAGQFHLAGRGTLAVGGAADVTVFDPETIGEVGTFDAPWAQPAGIAEVFVNGRRAVAGGVWQGLTAGKVLSRKG